jgi:hypothetical protein
VAAGLAALICCAAALRIAYVSKVFTHADDVGVAATILEARREFRGVDDLRRVIGDPALRQHDTLKFRLLRGVDQAGLLQPAYGLVSMARDVLVVPARWTYAPAQFAITAPLLKAGASYRQTLAAGRAPSAVFSMLAIGLLPWLLWRLGGAGRPASALVGGAVAALSVELAVYSLHMSNYALGVLAAVVLTWAVAAVSPERWRSWAPAAGFGLALWALMLLSYQVLPLALAAFVAIGITLLLQQLREDGRLDIGRLWAARATWLRLVLAGVVFVVLVVPVYVLLISAVRAITWNAGDHGQFLAPGGLADLGFLARNSWLTFSAMTTPVPWASPWRAPVTAALGVLFLIGLASLLSRPSETRRFRLGVFVAAAIAVTWALSLAKLTALSPTRHALVLLPVLALGVGEGAGALLTRVALRPGIQAAAAALAVAVMAAMWGLSVTGEFDRRRDPFDEDKLAAQVAALRPRAVIAYGDTYSVDLMPKVAALAPVFDADDLSFPWLAGRNAGPAGPLLIVSTYEPLSAQRRQWLQSALDHADGPGAGWAGCLSRPMTWSDVRPAMSGMEVYPIPGGGTNSYFAYALAPCGGAAPAH